MKFKYFDKMFKFLMFKSDRKFEMAIKRGDFRKARRSACHAIPNKNYFGMAVRTNIPTIELCLELGCKIDEYALFEVIKIKNSVTKFTIIDYLIDILGLNPNSKNIEKYYGKSIMFDVKDLETLKFFIEKHHADTNLQNFDGETVLMHHIINMNSSHYKASEIKNIIEYLLGKCNILITDTQGNTIMHHLFRATRNIEYYRIVIDWCINNISNVYKFLDAKNSWEASALFNLTIEQCISTPKLALLKFLLDNYDGYFDFSPNTIKKHYDRHASFSIFEMFIFSTHNVNRNEILKMITKLLDKGLNPYVKRPNSDKPIIEKLPTFIKDHIKEYFDSGLDIKVPDMD